MSSATKSEHEMAQSDSAVVAPHAVGFNANPRTINWERLEFLRLKKLHLGPERYSRHFSRFQKSEGFDGQPTSSLELQSKQPTQYVITPDGKIRKANSIAPFTTVGKPTCGFFFSRVTDNKKKKFGIPPTNLVKWRSFVQ